VISNALGRSTVRILLLGMLALAVAGGFSPSADARARQQGADEAQASATLTVRSTRFGRILFDGRGRALYAFTRDRRGGA
jgi:predicted lipoprotein with Yx(FWY)xxD motif